MQSPGIGINHAQRARLFGKSNRQLRKYWDKKLSNTNEEGDQGSLQTGKFEWKYVVLVFMSHKRKSYGKKA